MVAKRKRRDWGVTGKSIWFPLTKHSQQNQPFLAVKVELEQLVVSILDDPSGSSSSVGVFSSPCCPCSSENNQGGGTLSPNPSKIWHSHLTNHHSFEQNPFTHFPKGKIFTPGREDPNPSIEVLLGNKNNKKRNTVIVGDSVSLTEGAVAKLMGRIERGEVPDDLKQTHFIKFQFSQVELIFMKKEDIEAQVSIFERKFDSFTSWVMEMKPF